MRFQNLASSAKDTHEIMYPNCFFVQNMLVLPTPTGVPVRPLLAVGAVFLPEVARGFLVIVRHCVSSPVPSRLLDITVFLKLRTVSSEGIVHLVLTVHWKPLARFRTPLEAQPISRAVQPLLALKVEAGRP